MRLRPTDRPNVLRYFLALDTNQFTIGRQGKDEYQLGMDYAACATDSAQHRLYYVQGSLGGLLTKEDYESARLSGFPFFLEAGKVAILASLQLVFRDRKTGRMSSVRLLYGQPSAGNPSAPQLQATLGPERSTIGSLGIPASFGTTLPIPTSLCGDVYSLPAMTPNLPVFSELESMGAIYTTALNVPNLYIGGVVGDPQSLPWYGINYQGTFWITAPGKYEFRLASDDGANLYIDDQLVIDNDGWHEVRTLCGKADLTAGWHTIRVAYYQAWPTNVALTLEVKVPGQKQWQFFDTRSFVRSP